MHRSNSVPQSIRSRDVPARAVSLLPHVSRRDGSQVGFPSCAYPPAPGPRAVFQGVQRRGVRATGHYLRPETTSVAPKGHDAGITAQSHTSGAGWMNWPSRPPLLTAGSLVESATDRSRLQGPSWMSCLAQGPSLACGLMNPLLTTRYSRRRPDL